MLLLATIRHNRPIKKAPIVMIRAFFCELVRHLASGCDKVSLNLWCERRESNSHALALDSKSSASTSSATLAPRRIQNSTLKRLSEPLSQCIYIRSVK